jgi:hypothetical protein
VEVSFRFIVPQFYQKSKRLTQKDRLVGLYAAFYVMTTRRLLTFLGFCPILQHCLFYFFHCFWEGISEFSTGGKRRKYAKKGLF